MRALRAWLGSRKFQYASGVAGVGCLAWEAVSFFADQHGQHGMAELCLGLGREVQAERRVREARIRGAIEQARRQQAAGNRVDPLAVHHLLYPTMTPEAVRERADTYGNVKWSEEALAIALECSPLVEIGAGRGQWQKALSDRGADIISFDNMSSPGIRRGLIGKVLHGEEEVASEHSNRSLLLVYPNPGCMARKCLEFYTGDTLVYVGEGRGGVNADGDFFDLLAANWKLLKSSPVDTLPDCYERLWVLRRASTS